MTDGHKQGSTCIRLSPGERFFCVDAGESILSAGHRAGFAFPQACRNGNCFRCEGLLLSGTVEHLRNHCLTTAGDGGMQASTTLLPCIVTPRGDCLVSVEGVFGPGEMPQVTVAAQVVGVTILAEGIAQAQLRLPAGKKIARLAGQYLEIIDGENAYAFSIASAPASGRDIELHVRFGEDNPSSLRVMDLLRREPVVTLRLPMGECTLVGEPRLPLLFIAGATGFSQVKAFVEHALAQGWRVPVSVYWGARSADDIYLRDLAEKWASEHANVRFVPVVSGGAEQPASQAANDVSKGVRTGLVHEAVLADDHDFSNLLVYACGSPAMVYAALDAFVANGLPEERMFSDVFSWAPRP